MKQSQPWWDLQAKGEPNMANLSLKSLFESNKVELEQQLDGLRLPQDTSKVQQTITEYLNGLFDSDGEFRQNLTQSEDYILQAAMSLLNAQQEMSSALIRQGMETNKEAFSFSESHSFSKTEGIESCESVSSSESPKQSLLNTKMTPTQALIGSTSGALVGQILFSGWGAVFGAIAGTAIAVYVASRTKATETNATNSIVKKPAMNIGSQSVPLETADLISIISGICDSVDHLIDTFRAQINRVVSKYEAQEKPTFEKNYRPLLENIQSLIGYSRTHGEDEKYSKKIGERIEDLADMLDTYHLIVVDYSDEHDAWFEKVSSPNITQAKMVYPAIVKEGEIVIMGKMFVPEN